MDENEISYKIRGCIFKMYNQLGPGLLESTYQVVLMYELGKAGLKVRDQVPLPLIYDGIQLELGYRIDLLVEDKVIVEIKSVETLLDVHMKQILTYLVHANLRLGLLVNFNTSDIVKNIIRVANRMP